MEETRRKIWAQYAFLLLACCFFSQLYATSDVVRLISVTDNLYLRFCVFVTGSIYTVLYCIVLRCSVFFFWSVEVLRVIWRSIWWAMDRIWERGLFRWVCFYGSLNYLFWFFVLRSYFTLLHGLFMLLAATLSSLFLQIHL